MPEPTVPLTISFTNLCHWPGVCGVLRRGPERVWECRHGHYNTDDAIACAILYRASSSLAGQPQED